MGKIGIGAGAGAVIGGILGGKKGAAKGQEVRLGPGADVSTSLLTALTVRGRVS